MSEGKEEQVPGFFTLDGRTAYTSRGQFEALNDGPVVETIDFLRSMARNPEYAGCDRLANDLGAYLERLRAMRRKAT